MPFTKRVYPAEIRMSLTNSKELNQSIVQKLTDQQIMDINKYWGDFCYAIKTLFINKTKEEFIQLLLDNGLLTDDFLKNLHPHSKQISEIIPEEILSLLKYPYILQSIEIQRKIQALRLQSYKQAIDDIIDYGFQEDRPLSANEITDFFKSLERQQATDTTDGFQVNKPMSADEVNDFFTLHNREQAANSSDPINICQRPWKSW